MKISQITLFTYELAFNAQTYALSGDRVLQSQQALVVRIETDCGLIGWGETSPLGRRYSEAFFESEQAALILLADILLGLDPREHGVIQHAMAEILLAGMAAKCALDMACWDIAGKAARLPIAALLGGRMTARFPVWESFGLLPPDNLAQMTRTACQKGVTHFQIKIGNDPAEDVARLSAVVAAASQGCVIVGDANGGWLLQQALQALPALEKLPIVLEQPCASLADCREIRRKSGLPMIIDEPIKDLSALMEVKNRVNPGGVSIKPSRLGGITPARQLRDAAVAMGLMVTIDDCWGGALTTAALSQLAASTPTRHLFVASFFSELASPMIASAPKRDRSGTGSAPAAPGLGIGEVTVKDLKEIYKTTRS